MAHLLYMTSSVLGVFVVVIRWFNWWSHGLNVELSSGSRSDWKLWKKSRSWAWIKINILYILKTVRTPATSENIHIFCLQNMISFHNVHETCRWLLKYQMKLVLVFLSTFNLNIWYVHFNVQLNRNKWNLLNMLSVLIILAISVYTMNIL